MFGGKKQTFTNAASRPEIRAGDDAPYSSPPRVLIVDDDPTFGKIMMKAANQVGITMTYCQTLEEFGGLGTWEYDIAIIDCDLGAVTGCELTAYLEKYTNNEVPVILVSESAQPKDWRWPPSIQQFIHKENGPFSILKAADETHRALHRSHDGRKKGELTFDKAHP